MYNVAFQLYTSENVLECQSNLCLPTYELILHRHALSSEFWHHIAHETTMVAHTDAVFMQIIYKTDFVFQIYNYVQN